MQRQPNREGGTGPHPCRRSVNTEQRRQPLHAPTWASLRRPPPDVLVIQRPDLQAPLACPVHAARQRLTSSASAVKGQHPPDALTPHDKTVRCRSTIRIVELVTIP